MSLIPNSRPYKKMDSNEIAVRVTPLQNAGDPPLRVELDDDFSNFNEYQEVNSIGSGSSTEIISFTVPVTQTLKIKQITASGTNIATYTVEVDSSNIDKKRTYYTEYNTTFDFKSYSVSGGSVVKIKVIHNSPMVGDFNARLTGTLE